MYKLRIQIFKLNTGLLIQPYTINYLILIQNLMNDSFLVFK